MTLFVILPSDTNGAIDATGGNQSENPLPRTQFVFPVLDDPSAQKAQAERLIADGTHRPAFMPVGQIAGSATVQSATGAVSTWDGKVIEGTVDVTAEGQLVKIHLYLNGKKVASTWAVPPAQPENNYTFRFNLSEIWKYVGPSDRLQVRSGSNVFRLWNGQDHFRPTNNGAKQPADLFGLLSAGSIFNQFGQVQLSKTANVEWQQDIIDFYNEMRRVFLIEFGYELVVNYGTHLGAVREGNFIRHDHDFDCGFILDTTDSHAAGEALGKVALRLIELGYIVDSRRVCLWVSRPEKPKLKLDIFHLYFDAEGKLGYPYGVIGDRPFTRNNFTGYVNLKLGDSVVRGIGDPALLAEYIYGRNWRTPNPGFNWNKDRRERSGGVLSVEQNQALYWSNFYSRHANSQSSRFFDYITKAHAPAPVVVDIGCGDGRDSYAFGRTGRRVFSLDFSVIGVRRCSERAAEMGLWETVTFSLCDVSDAARLKIVLGEAVAHAQAIGAAITFYCRFFLHSVPDDTERTLLTVLSKVARPDDMFVSEFRIVGDDKLEKVHGNHYRRYLDPERFSTALKERYGFDIQVLQTGIGFSPYKGEDPLLARVVARKHTSLSYLDTTMAL